MEGANLFFALSDDPQNAVFCDSFRIQPKVNHNGRLFEFTTMNLGGWDLIHKALLHLESLRIFTAQRTVKQYCCEINGLRFFSMNGLQMFVHYESHNSNYISVPFIPTSRMLHFYSIIRIYVELYDSIDTTCDVPNAIDCLPLDLCHLISKYLIKPQSQTESPKLSLRVEGLKTPIANPRRDEYLFSKIFDFPYEEFKIQSDQLKLNFRLPTANRVCQIVVVFSDRSGSIITGHHPFSQIHASCCDLTSPEEWLFLDKLQNAVQFRQGIYTKTFSNPISITERTNECSIVLNQCTGTLHVWLVVEKFIAHTDGQCIIISENDPLLRGLIFSTEKNCWIQFRDEHL